MSYAVVTQLAISSETLGVDPGLGATVAKVLTVSYVASPLIAPAVALAVRVTRMNF